MQNKKVVLGIDTSCYTTSLAAVDLDGQVLGSFRKLLPVAPGQRGLRQSEAVFTHVRQLPDMFARMHEALGAVDIACVCASSKPRDDDQSYMPVFQVGDAQARILSSALGIPYFTSSHQQGHIAAARLGTQTEHAAHFLALHLSGGTMEMLRVDKDCLSLIGGTLDLHAGQLVDRTGVALGLPFPSGPHLETLARKGQSEARLPVSMEQGDLYCHLSGAETRVMQWIREETLSREDLAREVYDFLARTVLRLLRGGMQETGFTQALLAGGVASSALFRELLTLRVRKSLPDMQLSFGKPEYSGDNAVGIAQIGLQKYREVEACL